MTSKFDETTENGFNFLDYLPYCTHPSQEELMHAAQKHGSIYKASLAINPNGDTSNRYGSWRKIKARAAQQGFCPPLDLTHPVPDTHDLKGASTLYDENGNVKLQWVKSNLKREDMKETAQELVDALTANIKPRKAIKAPRKTAANQLTVYPLGDPHIGLYAWSEECGEDFDCEIAERNLCAGIDHLVESSTNTEQALIVNLGDFFHADNQDGTTKRNKNPLDVDSRKQRVTRIGVRIMVHLVDKALEKHKKVTVINEVGNHDDECSYMLSLILDAHYRNNKRVHIDLSPATFHYFRFGKVFIGVTHGHNTKPDQLGQIMAADRKEDWGETEFRYFLVGHIHHQTRKEVPGCIVESFRTLAAKDAYHASHGYRAGRDLVRITYHEEYGESGRETVSLKQIRGS